ncbi:hypothetical protein [Kineococcus radiotolerans]|uniref:hypothetical protein n=1 Tax=Kineococcus radiotolerans TaxID=131568 RepID=UPI00003A3CE9|nr:hypothetical protein [Kineococcus radiotolerans]
MIAARVALPTPDRVRQVVMVVPSDRNFARATFRADSRALLTEVTAPVLVLQNRADVLALDTAVRDVAARRPTPPSSPSTPLGTVRTSATPRSPPPPSRST